MELTFLGTGTSVGVPMIGCGCSVCTSTNPKNRRRRSCFHLQTKSTSLIIDTPPDFREQMLEAKINRIDAILFTHAHADHLFGLDDIRRFNTMQQDEVIPAYGPPEAIRRIHEIFSYIGQSPNALGLYRPLLRFEPQERPFVVGDVCVTPLPVDHGGIQTVGYLLETQEGRVGYVSDCCRIPEATLDALKGVDVVAIDALRRRPHPTHLCLSESLSLLKKIGAKRSYLIHIAHDLDYAQLSEELPAGVFASYDGLRVSLPLE